MPIGEPNLNDTLQNLMKNLNISSISDKIKDGMNNWTSDLERVPINDSWDKETLLLSSFLYKQTELNKKVYHYKTQKFFTPSKFETIKSAIQDVREILGDAVIEQVPSGSDHKINCKYYFINDGFAGYVSVQSGRKYATLNIELFSIYENVLKNIDKIIFDNTKTLNSQSIYVLTAGDYGLDITSIGYNDLSLEESNYTQSVLHDVNYVLNEFSKPEPFGRLAIFHGKPGTGKTYLCKAIFNDTRLANTKIVYTSPETLVKYSADQIIDLLINYDGGGYYKNDDGPILLFIEDADALLSQRGPDNRENISSMLNLSDGLIGHMLDIRILATTNMSTIELDKAIERKGRLCKLVKIDSLESEQANKVYQRISGKTDSPFDSSVVLADIYARAMGVVDDTNQDKNKLDLEHEQMETNRIKLFICYW